MVPLYDKNGTVPGFSGDSPSLCFEVHGITNQTFNLISDECTSVNALYSSMNNPDDGNIISSMGVKAVNNLRQCVEITVKLESGCIPVIRGTPVFDHYSSDGISVKKFGRRVKISVPNCENNKLDMWINCQVIRGQEMIKYSISHGINLQPTSHGLLGKYTCIIHLSTCYQSQVAFSIYIC